MARRAASSGLSILTLTSGFCLNASVQRWRSFTRLLRVATLKFPVDQDVEVQLILVDTILARPATQFKMSLPDAYGSRNLERLQAIHALRTATQVGGRPGRRTAPRLGG